MNICPSCGFNIHLTGEHSPTCGRSFNSPEDLISAFEIARNEAGPISLPAQALTEAVSGRAEMFIDQVIASMIQASAGAITPAAGAVFKEDMMLGVHLGYSMTFSVLFEQNIITTEALANFVKSTSPDTLG